MSSEILIVPKNGQGHLYPCIELCTHLINRNFKITMITDHDVISSIPPSLQQSHLFTCTATPTASGPVPPPLQHQRTATALEEFLTERSKDPTVTKPLCAIIDHIMYKTGETFNKFGIPTVTFITSGAAWAAIQHAAWKVQPHDMKPGEVRKLPGLPDEIVLNYSDLKQRLHWLPRPPPVDGGLRKSLGPRGPPLPGQPAGWATEVLSSIALLINTCDELERPFIDYISKLTGMPVWGVGPLLPDQYWRSSESLLRERETRRAGRESNYTDDQIIEWLDSKQRGSVLYVSFGSEVSPSTEEYPELAKALEDSTISFIWVIQRKTDRPEQSRVDYFPHGLDAKVGQRGLIIHGWAPQLLILSHPSTGGFLTHCGWNSTLEGLVSGVPFLAWPIRGDQYYNAKLVVDYLQVGVMVSEGYPADTVKMGDLIQGTEKVLTDEEIKGHAASFHAIFDQGFPATSLASLDAFCDLVSHHQNC